ncbi:hypothetical protein OSTOST_17810 [Ostertagia ostertagi]
MFDMDRMFTDKLDLPNIVLAIRMHGGDIEFGAKAYAERAGAITHVIVESIRTQHAHLALKDRKRLVTMQWLVDVLMKKQMDVPWRHAHLPSVFVDGCRPLLGKVRCAGVEKVEKAREWDIQVVNYQWLADNYAGQRVEADNQRYQLGQPCDGVSPGPYALEMINDQFKQLLQCSQRLQVKRKSRPKHRNTKKSGTTHPAYVVAFSGIDDENKHVLTQHSVCGDYRYIVQKLRYLGGRACEEVSECTHLVTTNGRRTERLLEAICLGKNIVNPYWIVHGYECRQWMG